MKVEVESYKPGGKYYTTGYYESEHAFMFQVFEEVQEMALRGNIPGLRDQSCWSSEPLAHDWVLRVNSDSEAGYPGLIPLYRDEYGVRTLKPPSYRTPTIKTP